MRPTWISVYGISWMSWRLTTLFRRQESSTYSWQKYLQIRNPAMWTSLRRQTRMLLGVLYQQKQVRGYMLHINIHVSAKSWVRRFVALWSLTFTDLLRSSLPYLCIIVICYFLATYAVYLLPLPVTINSCYICSSYCFDFHFYKVQALGLLVGR